MDHAVKLNHGVSGAKGVFDNDASDGSPQRPFFEKCWQHRAILKNPYLSIATAQPNARIEMQRNPVLYTAAIPNLKSVSRRMRLRGHNMEITLSDNSVLLLTFSQKPDDGGKPSLASLSKHPSPH